VVNDETSLRQVHLYKYALLVDQLYPLHPKIINQQILNAARVEAVMRKSNQPADKDKVLETIEYIEAQHSLI